MNHMTKQAREDYTKALFDAIWDGKRVWDALVDMEVNRHISPIDALNCQPRLGRGDAIKYEMDWKDTGLKVVLEGFPRPPMGIWEIFLDTKDRCFNEAIKWLDKASDEKQSIISTVMFLAGNTPVRGADRNRKLAKKFIDYINSIQPKISQKDANYMADVVINND